MWEAYEWLTKQNFDTQGVATDPTLDAKTAAQIREFDEFMNDDLNTAKVLANMFELSSVINSIKDKHIAVNAISGATLQMLQQQMKVYVEDIFGLTGERTADDGKLDGVLQLLIDIRKDAKQRKDFVTSDKIRNELAALGVQLKDEKDGGVSYTIQ